MATKYLWIKNQRYYLYDSYSNYQEARKTANYFRKKNKCRFFIQIREQGFLIPEKRYDLYLNKCIRIW